MSGANSRAYPTIQYTAHALSRQARRNLSDEDVLFVYAHGRRVHCAGSTHVFLGRRDIPSDRDIYRRYAHLEGTTLVMDNSTDASVLITAYRNRRGLKKIRAKTKYER